MKKQRFSTEQIVAVLKQAELGLAVKDLIRQIGITEQTFYRWKRQYGGLESDQVRELKQVVEENARLKKLVAELSLDKAVLQDVLSKKFPGQRSRRKLLPMSCRGPATESAGRGARSTSNAHTNTNNNTRR